MKYIVDIHGEIEGDYEIIGKYEERLPERLTDDDFETIRIHLNAFKENLCNQRRWKEAEEYQRIIDRFMAFASAQSEQKKGKWIKDTKRFGDDNYHCSVCSAVLEEDDLEWRNNYYCYHCGCRMEEGDSDDML